MAQIKRFGIFQTAKFMGVMYLVTTAIIFIPLGLIMSTLGASLVPEDQLIGGLMTGAGMFVMPFIYAVFGFIFVAISCLAYNIIARMVGGIEVEIQ